MELIDKAALVAEIKRLIDRSEYNEVYDYAFRDGNNAVCVHILNFLEHLEVKEVDLDKLIDDYMLPITAQDVKEEPFTQLEKCAKHFFELGLKTKK